MRDDIVIMNRKGEGVLDDDHKKRREGEGTHKQRRGRKRNNK